MIGALRVNIVCNGYQKVKNSFFQNLISGKHQCQKFCVQIWTDILSELGPDYLQRLTEDITSWQGLFLFFLQKSSFRNTISVIEFGPNIISPTFVWILVQTVCNGYQHMSVVNKDKYMV